MKKTLSITLAALAILWSCNSSKNENTNTGQSTDTTEVVLTDSIPIDNKLADTADKSSEFSKKEPVIITKNASDYSSQFIKELKEQHYERFELIDSLMIINHTDTAYFASIPKMGEHIVLTAIKDNLAISLIIKRINYTTIEYTLEMVEFGKTSHSKKGQAHLRPSFFLGSETDESTKTKLSYSVEEFSDRGENNCYTIIRLGYEEETGPYLLGKIIATCNGKIKDINLDNFNTLIEK